MIRSAAAAAAAGVCAGYLARCELARRHRRRALLEVPPRRAPGRDRWLLRAVAAIRANIDDGEHAVSVTVAVRDADGCLAVHTMRPGDIAPVVMFGAETDLDGATALVFHGLDVPDSPAGLEGSC